MTAFRSGYHSVAFVPTDAERIWTVLAKAELVAELFPLVARIEPRGDVWRWTLAGVSRRGVQIAPSFTERMTFVPISRVEFRHEPPPGSKERIGLVGVHQITKVDDATSKLRIDLELRLQLPLPEFGRRVVERVMAAGLRRAGTTFSRNLYAYLDVDPSAVRFRTLTTSV